MILSTVIDLLRYSIDNIKRYIIELTITVMLGMLGLSIIENAGYPHNIDKILIGIKIKNRFK